jgi:hypothetical protein
MFIGATAAARAMKAAFDLAEVSLKAGEMTVAAGAVISVRAGMIATAQQDPLNADHVELGRMVPEKVKAFSEAGAAAVEELWSLQRDIADYMLYVARTMTLGRPPARPSDIVEFAERSVTHGARIATTAIGAAAVTLAPLHEKATSNARRLARRRHRA